VLVARAAAQPLEDVIRTLILGPLGMTDTGFTLTGAQAERLPSYYLGDFQGGAVKRQDISGPEIWTRPPAVPSGAAGLASTIDDYLAFARLLINKGVHKGERILSEKSVELMTANHLTPDQIAHGRGLLSGRGWGFRHGRLRLTGRGVGHPGPLRLERRLRDVLVQRSEPRPDLDRDDPDH
jgi:CubicO group peptidase (beta-lactamase class C family)